MKSNIVITTLISIFIAGCSSVIEPDGVGGDFGYLCDACQKPDISNGLIGKFWLRWDLKNDMATASNVVQKHCAAWNGLKTGPSVHTRYPNMVLYTFQCNGLHQPSIIENRPIEIVTPTKLVPNQIGTSIEEAKSKCADLGFKLGTEGFGKCVLKLSK